MLDIHHKPEHSSPVATPERRSPSIEDVAKAAAVSIATVSRVVNNPALVAPKTARRVQRIINKLDYRPNLFAKGLTTRRSNVLGVALPDLFGEFYSELLRGADSEARRQGYHLLVSSEARIASGLDMDQGFNFGLIDGLAVMITEPDERIWDELQKTTIPIVVLDAEVRFRGISSVVVDSEVGARMAMEHLLQSVRPKDCYFIGGPRQNFDTAERARAFSTVLSERAHAPTPDQITFGDYTLEFGRIWADENLTRLTPNMPIGILAANDEIAYGVMQVALDRGLAIPGNIRLIGFDDSRLAALVRPRLSSVRVPAAEVGAAAIRLLVERILSPDASDAKLRLASRLTIRESSAPPSLAPRHSRAVAGPARPASSPAANGSIRSDPPLDSITR